MLQNYYFRFDNDPYDHIFLLKINLGKIMAWSNTLKINKQYMFK